MPKNKHLHVVCDENLYADLKLIAVENGYSELSKLVRHVLKSYVRANPPKGEIAPRETDPFT